MLARVKQIWARLRQWAQRIKRDLLRVYFAIRDPDMPRALRVLAVVVLAYALSPIDLIPDFVPVLGYLDDLILVPLGIWLILRWLPPAVLERATRQAGAVADQRVKSPVRWAGAAMVIAVWIVVAVIGYVAFVHFVN
jgi:uncharacterized membrane protein YkvA (DUF1232 family)